MCGVILPRQASRCSLAGRPTTLRTHVQNIMTKLRGHSKLEAVAFGVRQGLVEAPRGRIAS